MMVTRITVTQDIEDEKERVQRKADADFKAQQVVAASLCSNAGQPSLLQRGILLHRRFFSFFRFCFSATHSGVLHTQGVSPIMTRETCVS